MSKVYDCCMVYEEIDMLELRMNILAPVVDHFVVVESGQTHSGLPKGHPVGDALMSPRFAPFADKIVYQFVETLEGANAWEREHYQRGLISGVLQYFAEPEDWVIVGDADEIANPEAIRYALEGSKRAAWDTFKLEMAFYYYDFQHRVQQGWAIGMTRWKWDQDANKIRTCEFSSPPMVIDNAGWHFSYFGDASAIMRKARAFMHFDWIDAYGLTEAKVQQALDAGTDLWGRDLQIECVLVSDSLPRAMLEHREKYEKLGWLERQAVKA